MIVDTSASRNARMSMAGPGSVRLAGAAPLATLYERGLGVTVPTMGELMFDPAVAHAHDNFRVASGDADGDFVGYGFMDGDFYKWLEAAVVAPAGRADEHLLEQIETAVRSIAAAQADDGYLQTKTLIAQRKGAQVEPLDDRADFETYNFGHLMTLACIHHRATGSAELLDVARRLADYLEAAAADHPEKVADCNICPSHYMGVVELYRTTGEERHLALADRLLALHGGKGHDGSDDNQDVLDVREQRSAVGHSVRANYLYAGMADYALEADDPRLVEALESIWHDLVSSKLYITGGCGALYDGVSPDVSPDRAAIKRVHQAYGRPHQLPQTTAYNETCASLGLVMWAWRMLALTGDGTYADEIERVLYNALPAAIGADGTTYFYTNPLRQVRGLGYPMRRAGDSVDDGVLPSHDRPRQGFMDVFCCPPNIARVIAELPYYVYAQREDELWVHQYVESEFEAVVAGTPFRLRQSTDYPARGDVVVSVRADRPTRATLRVRVPGWATAHRVLVNGEPVAGVEHGYAAIDREWSDDTVSIAFEIAPQLVVAHHFVEEATNQVCVVRGPVVYCVEEADLPEATGVERVALVPGAEWREEPGTGIFEGHALLTAKGKRLTPQVPDGRLYRPFDPAPAEDLDVRLIPYALWGNRGAGEMTVWMSVQRGEAA